jgi:hypothetical protein
LLYAWVLVLSPYFLTIGSDLNTPKWMADHPELLPKVTPDIIERLRGAWKGLQISDTALPNPPQSFFDAVRTILELEDYCIPGFVWIYAEDIPKPLAEDRLSLREKASMLNDVFALDPASEKWMLPLLRLKLDWLERLLKAGQLDTAPISHEEIGAIEGYMNMRGTHADIDRVHELMSEIAASGTNLGRSVVVPDERTLRDNVGRREGAQSHPDSLCDNYRPWEKKLGSIKKYRPHIAGEASAPSSNGLPSLEASGPSAVSETLARSPLIAWSVVIVAAIGLLWLLLKRRS